MDLGSPCIVVLSCLGKVSHLASEVKCLNMFIYPLPWEEEDGCACGPCVLGGR